MTLHFISGLPRSGSTLLAAILKQNPRFTAGMSSPVGTLYRANEAAMAQQNEGAVFISDEQRRDILKGLFSSFYKGCEGTVFDTNRMWAARLPALAQLFPDAKVICCVRDCGWIVDSFERIHMRNPFEPSGIYGFNTGGTVYSRAAQISGGDGVLGYALNAMREAMAGPFNERLLLVEYETLCKEPGKTLQAIYDFIGEDAFAHDFGRVEYSASEFDRNIGARGLHDVNGAVEWRERKTVLPLELFAQYAHDQFWRVGPPAAPSPPLAARPKDDLDYLDTHIFYSPDKFCAACKMSTKDCHTNDCTVPKSEQAVIAETRRRKFAHCGGDYSWA